VPSRSPTSFGSHDQLFPLCASDDILLLTVPTAGAEALGLYNKKRATLC